MDAQCSVCGIKIGNIVETQHDVWTLTNNGQHCLAYPISAHISHCRNCCPALTSKNRCPDCGQEVKIGSNGMVDHITYEIIDGVKVINHKNWCPLKDK